MEPFPQDDHPVPPALDQITTSWSQLHDHSWFVARYAPAIWSYLQVLVRNRHDAEEILQDFLARVVEHGFGRAAPDRGRFRDYLKTAVRNSAMTHYRRRRPERLDEATADRLAEPQPEADAVLDHEWCRCLLARAWRETDRHQRQTPGNLFYTVLRMTADFPEEDSTRLAERTSQSAGREVSAEAFRKQLSRARRFFANLIVRDVAETLDSPTPEGIRDELIQVGLMPYVQDYFTAN